MSHLKLLQKLGPKAQGGSKPRCHWLTHGTPEQVAERLTKLIDPYGTVSPCDHWMPKGFCHTEEAQLDKASKLLPKEECDKLRDWWLAVPRKEANTPNWDIASTYTVNDKKGLLLVEAKAHVGELCEAAKGKGLSKQATADSRRNHVRIEASIQEANIALADKTKLCWTLSRDRCYQMSNRFAWSGKLTELGYPVIIVYLGFLNAEEMKETGKDTFGVHADWACLVKKHSQRLFTEKVWDNKREVHDQPFVPLIRSCEISHNEPIKSPPVIYGER